MPIKRSTVSNLTDKDKTYILDARREGCTYGLIAEVLGVSKDTIRYHASTKRRNEVLKQGRAYKESHREELKGRQKKFYEDNPTYRRDRARISRLNTGVGTVHGLNKRPYPPNQLCEFCGNISLHLSYHHWDPADLNVGLWLCAKCHRIAEVFDLTGIPSLQFKYSALKKRAKSESIAAKWSRKMEVLRGI